MAFGLFIYRSLSACFYILTSPPEYLVNATTQLNLALLVKLILTEVVLFVIISIYLWLRGWRLQHFRLNISWKNTVFGIGLYIVSVITFYVLYFLFEPLVAPFSFTEVDPMATQRLPLFTISVVSIVNSIYEETFVVGYVYTAVRQRYGKWTAINTSAAIRLCYHLYQGPISAISIIPVGILFCFVYARNGRLWSLIVAHAIFDLVGLVVYFRSFAT